ncbi:MAG: hypothetical protein Q4E17_03160 [Synergistes sp.]|nr:hypothetical protein [Synergistes sp.]
MVDKIAVVLLVTAGFTNAAGSTIMKYAYGGQAGLLSDGIIRAFLKILMNPCIVAGFGCFGISFFLMAAALSRADLTFSYPLMTATAYLLLTAIGCFFFHENMTIPRLGGMLCIIIGITLLTVKG